MQLSWQRVRVCSKLDIYCLSPEISFLQEEKGQDGTLGS